MNEQITGLMFKQMVLHGSAAITAHPALHIYEKYGFYEIPVDNTHHYKRVDIQFEYAAK